MNSRGNVMEENKYEKELMRLRNILFILSLCSIFLGLVIVGGSANKAPIPEDPYSMIENMWNGRYIDCNTG